MKIIFLDFDGVINNFNHFDGIDYNNVKYLLEIIKLTDAKIVVTSSNKYVFQRNNDIDYRNTTFFEYVKTLNDYGVEIFDVTPYAEGKRELEINMYLKVHPEIEQFLILDDEYVSDKFREHQVFLDLYNGICDEHVKPAVDILNGMLGFYPKDFDFNETIEERMVRINLYHSKKR